MQKRLRFLSGNKHKILEVQQILAGVGIDVLPAQVPIAELQIQDMEGLVRDKCRRAYEVIGHPLFVEHTGLYLKSLNGFPGGLTQVFWDTLQADRFCALYGSLQEREVIAKTIVGYCDGRVIREFCGQVSGHVSPDPRGNRDFQWDCVFIPDGESQTFAELGTVRKNEISMRRKAIDNFVTFLREDAE